MADETQGSAGATAPQTEADIMPSLQEALRIAELKAAEHHDAWLRAKAETENVRRRGQDEAAKASKFAVEKFVKALIPVRDSLEAALTAEGSAADALRNGVELTLKQLDQAFAGAGIIVIDPLEQKFDPHQHQAISMVEADGEPNRVVTVLQKGYLLHERTVRPALVIVSRARSAPAATAPNAAEPGAPTTAGSAAPPPANE
ncbi:MAG: nucleotide exchange factor GrpE [Rhodocyclaceae bacterium]|nr:nucleotide exchange factor GrpE [Rhodocyclaceae bacterium]